MAIKFAASQILNNNTLQRSKKLKFLVTSKGESPRAFQDAEPADTRPKSPAIVSVAGPPSPGTSVSWELIMPVHMAQNDALISTGVHMSAVYAVDATPQPDAEATTPNNKALNTLGTTPIEVFGLSSYLKDSLAKCYNINRF